MTSSLNLLTAPSLTGEGCVADTRDGHFIIATAQVGTDNNDVTESPPQRVSGGLRLLRWAARQAFWVLILAFWGWSLWPRQSSLQPGPAGNARYAVDALLLVPAAALLLSRAIRLARVIAVGRANDETSVVLQSSGRTVLAAHARDGRSLEWRVLRARRPWPSVAGAVHVRGTVAPGWWVVVRLADGRLIWPRTRVQSVVGTAVPKLPAAVLAEHGVIGTVHRLFAGYVQTISLVPDLPLVIRRRPGPDRMWWKLGAPRMLVQVLLVMHQRRRLRAVASALVRAAVLSDARDGGRSRRRLVEASQECQALAGVLPRRGWLPVLATVGTVGLTLVGPLLPLARVSLLGHVITQHAVQIIVFSFVVGVLPLVVFFRSVRCKRALLGAFTAIPTRTAADEAAARQPDWDVYRLERDAFAAVHLPEPREWESRGWISWLVFAAYATVVGILVMYADPVIGAIVVVAALAALFALARWRGSRAARRLRAAHSRAVTYQPLPELGVQPAE
jgi:hypothetical protein